MRWPPPTDELVDDLVSPEMSCYATPGTEVEWVGKRGGRCSASQGRIQQRTLEYALAATQRGALKGATPCCSADAGEEVAALQAHGVPVEVVNGISSGLAAAQALGIALTHRAHCHGVTFVTGHTCEHGSPCWAALVRGGTTLVIVHGHEPACGDTETACWRRVCARPCPQPW